MRTIEWKNNRIRMIDQTLLPGEFKYIDIKNIKVLWQAIKELKVRGAPALGASACLGVYLGIKDSKAKDYAQFYKELKSVVNYLASSRPTARNLFWGLERMLCVSDKAKHLSVEKIKKTLFQEANKVIEEDRASCRRIGAYGASLVKKNERILTICNTGILATIDYGTALGVIYKSHEQGKNIKVFACETRPLLQGARLTTWELKRSGIDVTLICDSMAASLMKSGSVDKVIVGADRIALNGDTANKIGTYSLAVLAKYHKIPFYAAAPFSTFDLDIKTGMDILIEERSHEEVSSLFFKNQVTAKGIKFWNPAFDVTPNNLITAIITDRGIIKPLYKLNIEKYADK
ncbi:MAG: S-methyl-5-thioribose-1-phosphate isomerase [Candidatus Omnitrophica bacterium]|nr:S-methyl-5-thioribose-1-phosphate isomerase [Candidatus Omnitrophota bacterium]